MGTDSCHYPIISKGRQQFPKNRPKSAEASGRNEIRSSLGKGGADSVKLGRSKVKSDNVSQGESAVDEATFYEAKEAAMMDELRRAEWKVAVTQGEWGRTGRQDQADSSWSANRTRGKETLAALSKITVHINQHLLSGAAHPFMRHRQPPCRKLERTDMERIRNPTRAAPSPRPNEATGS